jgi:hypothetical protein
MAKILTKAGITTGNTVEAFHVTQSIDAFTGIDAYDISLSGSFNMTGPTNINGDTTITGSLTINQTSISSSTESPIIEVKVSDSDSYLRVNNNTMTDGFFTPALTSRQANSPDRLSFVIDSIVDLTHDTPGAIDVMRFRARRDSDFIQNRNLYAWYNYTNRLMDMDAAGNLNIVAGVTASSYTGSFVGDGSGLTGIVSSSYALTASYALNGGGGSDTNFANTDLTFTGNRTHFLNNNYLFITDTFIPTSSFLYLDVVAQETQIGLGNSYLSFDSTTIDFIQSGSSRVEINSTETIINGGGGNYDFRVKGDTDNVLLYVDASTDRVAIGKNTPNAKLDVNGNTIITGSLTVSNSLNTEGAKVRKYRTITLTDADFAISPSDKINADDDIILVINNTTSTPLVGEANFGISSFLASPSGRCVEIVCIKSGSYGISLSDPDMVGLRLWLNDQSQAGGFRQVCSDVGESITLMSYELDASGSAWGNGY